MTSRADEASTESIFAEVIRTWKHGIDTQDTAEIGSVFAGDALFQGGDPEPCRGRASVMAYYGRRPLTGVDHEVIDVRRSADDVIVGYATVHFHVPGAVPTAHRHVTMVLERNDERWLIGHYHVSVVPVTH